MLRITVNKNATGLVKYFTNSLSKDDYFFTGKSIPGYWHGQLKNDLGLPQEVSQKTFSRLAHNIHPRTGEKLTVRNAKGRRSSLEYTFNAPKSLSIVMALADEKTGKQILNAHRLAVKKSMIEAEKSMQVQTRINGRNVYVPANGIIYARFDHLTSRPTNDPDDPTKTYSSDMNLHSHCIVMNCTKFNGRYQAIEASTIHRTAEYYEELYHSHLSKSLQDMGFDIRRDRKRWEIYSEGLTRRTIEKFSRRTTEIEAEIKKRGITSAAKKAKVGALTRKAKSKLDPNLDLKKHWLSKLTARELTAIKTARGRVKASTNTITPERAIDLSLKHYLERKSAVPTKKILAQGMKLGYGKLTPKQLSDELQKRQNIVYADKGYVQYLTTKELIKEECKMIDFASQTQNTIVALHPTYKIKRDFLSTEQRSAIHQILNSKDQVTILAGGAGVGKTTALQEIREAVEEKNKSIFAFAQSASASRDTLRANGFKNANTIAHFLKNKELQAQTKNQVILIDEAGMLGVRDTAKIFDIAKHNKARVILAGDVRQHSSPAYGDACRILMERSKLPAARIDKIQRQKPNPKYKAAIKAMADGKIRLGFDRLDKMGAIIEIEHESERHEKLAKDYISSVEAKRSALVIAPTHAEGERLNKTIRAQMKVRKRIKGADKSVIIHKPLSLTAAQKQDSALYEQNQIVQFFQNAPGFKAGQKYEVSHSTKEGDVWLKQNGKTVELKLPKDHAERFQVFEKEALSVAQGDLIRITSNGKCKEKTRLYNGQIIEVAGVNKAGDIQLTGGKTLDKNFGHFTHGYVMTSHASQSRNCDVIFIAQSELSFGASNKKQFYVSASRAKSKIKIYTEDKNALREAISKGGDRLSATELADRAKTQKMWKQRVAYYNKITKEITKDERAKEQFKTDIHRGIER